MRVELNTTSPVIIRLYHACAALGALLTPALIVGFAWEVLL